MADDTVLAARQVGLIEAFYRGVTDTAAFEQAMTLFGDAFNCQATALVALDASAPRANISVATGAFGGAMRMRYAQEYIAVDPAPSAFARLPTGKASTSDRIMSPEAVRRDVFFNEFFRPLGLTETIGVVVGSGNGRFEMFGLQRGDDRPAFTDGELSFVETIVPHAARALQLRRLLLTQTMLASSFEATLDRIAAGILVIDQASPFTFANAAMQAISRRGDGLGLDRAGRLAVADSGARRRLDALLAAVMRGGAGGTVAVPSAARTRPYAVLVAPLPGGVADALAPAATGAMIVVHDPATQLSAPVDLLREALDLPPGAADLTLALANGHDLKSYSAMQGITIHTARFHLRTALARTGATSQAELMKVTVRLLSDLGRWASLQ